MIQLLLEISDGKWAAIISGAVAIITAVIVKVNKVRVLPRSKEEKEADKLEMERTKIEAKKLQAEIDKTNIDNSITLVTYWQTEALNLRKQVDLMDKQMDEMRQKHEKQIGDMRLKFEETVDSHQEDIRRMQMDLDKERVKVNEYYTEVTRLKLELEDERRRNSPPRGSGIPT